MNRPESKKIPVQVERYAISTVFISYIPHWLTSPVWLNGIVLCVFCMHGIHALYPAIRFGFIARVALFVAGIAGMLLNLQDITQGNFFLILFIFSLFLKALELSTIRDCRAIALGNLFLIFTALILQQDLWILPWLGLAIFSELLLLIKMTNPETSIVRLSVASSKCLLWSLPFALLLFYFFPRLSHPLWKTPTLQSAQVGFSDQLQLGQFSELFYNEDIAMRVYFNLKKHKNPYWRGAILSHYNGQRWTTTWRPMREYSPLPLATFENAHYEIILEPTQSQWLFYQNTPVSGNPNMHYNTDSGLIRANQQSVTQRFRYLLTTQKKSYHPISPQERRINLWLPPYSNPALQEWTRKQLQNHSKPLEHILHSIKTEIQQKPFWYTLSPKPLPETNQQLDHFWFKTREGYCEHYASAVAVILRTAGIPARIIVGYQGGRWNPLGQYLEIQQSNAHAWLEYWQNEVGWVRLDPVQFIAPERIEPAISARNKHQADSFSAAATPDWWKFWQHGSYYLETIRYFSERWLLFYNQDTQFQLLQHLSLGALDKGQLMQLSIAIIILLMLGAAWMIFLKHSRQSPLQREKRKWLRFLQQQRIEIHPSQSFRRQCIILQTTYPKHRSYIQRTYTHYEKIRLQQSKTDSTVMEHSLVRLLRSLRRRLQKLSYY